MVAVAGLYAAEFGTIFVLFAGVAWQSEFQQVAYVFRGALVVSDVVVHLQGPLVLVRAESPVAAPSPLGHQALHPFYLLRLDL